MQQARLPQLEGGWFLTDGGIETVLIFNEGVQLPEFAAFVLLDKPDGRDMLRRYYRRYLDIAAGAPGAGYILESPTWRAGNHWGARLGFDAEAMQRFNAAAAQLMHELRREYAPRIGGPIVVSGCVGPRGDGYVAGTPMEPEDARGVHQPQVDALAARKRRHDHSDHDDDQRRGDGCRARRGTCRTAVRDLVHGRDRRFAAERRDARRGDRSG